MRQTTEVVFQRYAWFNSGYKFIRQITEAVFQRYAWFNSGYKFMRQTTEAVFQRCCGMYSSSCGAYCGVVHSPFEWFDHRCHCNCRYLVLFSGVCVAMSCGGGGSSLDDAYDSAWDSVLPTVVGCAVMSCGGESFFPAVLTITHGIALSR